MADAVGRLALAALLVATAACGGEYLSPAPHVLEREDYTAPPEFRVPNELELTGYVDPMIGTEGPGNVIPGALVPHGMLRLSPDTNSPTGSIDAYDYGDDRIEGFTHLHLEGPGGSSNGYNQIRFMPTLTSVAVDDASSAYSHETEEAEPGYYAVTLDDTEIRVELTAAARAAVHHYTFAPGQGRVVLDLGSSNGISRDGWVEIVGDRSIRGMAEYSVHPALTGLLWAEATPTAISRVYFYAELSEPFVDFGTWQQGIPLVVSPGVRSGKGSGLGAWLDVAGGDVELRVGISLIDAAQAEQNMRHDLGDRDFTSVRALARDAWNAKLNRIQIEANEPIRTMFYTALYRSMFQPANYTEADGRFVVAASGERHLFDGGGRPFYLDDWCMWDTFRTTHPLGGMLEPENRADVVRSMLRIYQQGGWLPKCTWNATGYSRVMTGNPSIPIIVDAWMKGLNDFDADLAWEAMKKSSDQDSENVVDGACGYLNLGTPREYIENGYVGYECDLTQAASMTLEHAQDDACMATMAAELGKEAERARYAARAQSFHQHWDAGSGFMRPKLRDGSWLEPFDPADTSDGNGFVEASAWIFTFFVPHDVPALIDMMGGPEAFVAKLDEFFDGGHFDASNQPSFHIPWLYNYAGAAAETQARVRELALANFSAEPDGLPGNDDSGAMSSWFVLAALGMYPVNVGDTVVSLSAPLVDRATIYLHSYYYDGGTFVIETERQGDDAYYIQSATLNGKPLTKPSLTHAEIVAGGTLHYVLGPSPSGWGESP